MDGCFPNTNTNENIISFVQNLDVNFTWGVTDILLDKDLPVVPVSSFSLALGVEETGSHGNNFNGSTDADGIVSASFTGTGEDLLLSFDGYDIDYPDEVEVLLETVAPGQRGPDVGHLGHVDVTYYYVVSGSHDPISGLLAVFGDFDRVTATRQRTLYGQSH